MKIHPSARITLMLQAEIHNLKEPKDLYRASSGKKAPTNQRYD